jgi:hypothetical protein
MAFGILVRRRLGAVSRRVLRLRWRMRASSHKEELIQSIVAKVFAKLRRCENGIKTTNIMTPTASMPFKLPPPMSGMLSVECLFLQERLDRLDPNLDHVGRRRSQGASRLYGVSCEGFLQERHYPGE